MISSYALGQPAQITFTSDYHELVLGDLRAGVNCRISYDPLRIVPQNSSYTHGDPNQPVFAHIQFQEDGPEENLGLYSPMGIVENPHRDPTGARSAMLVEEFNIPEGAKELIIWFSYFDRDTNQTYYDSDRDQNFRFRWPYHDVQIKTADVIAEKNSDSEQENPTSCFKLEVSAIPEITEVLVRWSLVNSPESASNEIALKNTGSTDESGKKIWSTSSVVPYGATVRFKLFYILNGKRYKNDNSSSYFFAPEPKRIEAPPLPNAPIRA